MNREDVVKRIAEIEKGLAEVVASHNALSGHLKESQFWLAEMDKFEKIRADVEAIAEGNAEAQEPLTAC